MTTPCPHHKTVCRHWPHWVVWGIFLAGAIWRYHYLLHVHPATQFIYSDMQAYVQSALAWFDPHYVPTIVDTLYPPATGYFFGWLHRIDPSWHLALIMQWILSALVPVCIAAFAYDLFGKRVALLSLAMASVYFPFIDYASYFLSENLLLFCLMLAMTCLARALSTTHRVWRVISSALAGVMLGLAAVTKSVVLLPGLLIVLALGYHGLRYRARYIAWILIGATVGLCGVVVPAAQRCTRLNEGHYCTISTNGGIGVLIGHYNGLVMGHFRDDQRHTYFEFGSPPDFQTGLPIGPESNPEFSFGPYDSARALDTAWQQIKNQPLNAVLRSIEHVFGLFTGSVPWPTSHTPQRRWAIFFQEVYWVALLFPALVHLVQQRRALWRMRGTGLADALMILPLLGLMIVAFCTMGEPRFRIPFDGLMIVLAARCYLRDPYRESPADA